MKNILVTGGAGYIGSVVVDKLIEKNYLVWVLDDLREGNLKAINENAHWLNWSLEGESNVNYFFEKYKFDAVIHLASLALVGDSMISPITYLRKNIDNFFNVLAPTISNNVKKFIFASTGNVYACRDEIFRIPFLETDKLNPSSPYGESKYAIERILNWMNKTYNVEAITFRFFNVAGATDIRGEWRKRETHLIPQMINAAIGNIHHLEIHGNNYSTPDGTCIRDYIHVEDIADAVIKALEINYTQDHRIINLGSNYGHSVLEIIEAFEKITKIKVPILYADKRPGDPAYLMASNTKAKRLLNWSPKHDLYNILNSAWRWRQNHPNGY